MIHTGGEERFFGVGITQEQSVILLVFWPTTASLAMASLKAFAIPV
jgi:hypothetical protein